MAIDLLQDRDLRMSARHDLEERLAGKPYVSPIPEERRQPRGLDTIDSTDSSIELGPSLELAVGRFQNRLNL
jgi:hypothetical protein